MNDKVTYWVEMSDYDFDTAKAMLETKRYLYVAFMCHPNHKEDSQSILEQSVGRTAFEDSQLVKTCGEKRFG